MNLSSDKLRKAAVLIASLDEAAADRLLQQMGPAMADRVQKAVDELGPIDPAERKAVIAEFLERPAKSPAPASAVEVAFSPAARRQIADHSASSASPPANPSGRFGFLHEMTGEMIARALAGESPQTAAVVLSHLSPAHAAQTLAHCEPARQVDLLRRVADLGEMQPEIVAEIEQHLQNLFSDQLRSQRRRREGAAAVGAIVAAAGPFEGAEWLARLSRHDRELATAVRHGQTKPAAEARREGEAPAEPLLTEQRGSRSQARQEPRPPGLSFEFRDLEQLDNRSLAMLLRASDPQVALLALAGASRSLVNRILRELSTTDADVLEQRMQRIGPVRLRDVESAQQVLATLAEEMAAKKEIQLPPRGRKLAMVA